MFGIDDRDIKRLENDLETFKAEAGPFATRKTLNDTAFAGMKIARNDFQRDFITRNKHAIQSIRVNPARSLIISQQEASLGSIADYMKDQEFGGLKRKRGGEGVAIATSYAAGQAEGSEPRRKLPRRPNRLASIQLRRQGKKGHTRAQRNLIAVKMAAESGNKFIFMDLGKRKGIFRVLGGKRNPQVKMVHDLTRTTIRIPRKPWLKPSFDEALRLMPAFYADALRFQLRRHGIFRR